MPRHVHGMDRGALTVLTVVGTRPEVIKMAPVLHELARHRGVRPVLCVTGQPREIVEDALKLFGLTEDHNLAVMERDQALGPLTSRLVERLDAIVQRVQPRWVIAQGDTTSVMAAAMVGFYRNVSFAHVEAGLRTGDLRQPFPEEFNRRVASLAAQLHFAPTEHASAALQREGVPPSRIHVTGNTGIDALLQMASRPHVPAHALLRDVPPEARVVLVTAHRRESFGHPLVEICEAVAELARVFAGDRVHFVYPVRPRPAATRADRRAGRGRARRRLVVSPGRGVTPSAGLAPRAPPAHRGAPVPVAARPHRSSRTGRRRHRARLRHACGPVALVRCVRPFRRRGQGLDADRCARHRDGDRGPAVAIPPDRFAGAGRRWRCGAEPVLPGHQRLAVTAHEISRPDHERQ